MKADRHLISIVSTVGVFASVPVAAVEWNRWDLEGSLFITAACIAIAATVAPEFLANLTLEALAAVGYDFQQVFLRPEDGPHTILSQMRLHMKDEDKVVVGLKALLVLTDSDSKDHKEATGKLLRLGLVQVLTLILETYDENASVVVRTLTVLRRVSTLPEVCSHFEEAGGAAVAPVVLAMRTVLSLDQAGADTPDEKRSRRCAEVQRLGALILGAVCDERNELKTAVVDEGFAAALLEAMDWFRHHEPLAQWALWALFNATFNHTSNKVDLVRKGALKTVVTAMDAHPNSAGVQRQAVALLFSCLMQGSTAGADGSSGVVVADVPRMREVASSQGMNEAVEAACKAHPKDKSIQGMGQQILAASSAGGAGRANGGVVSGGRELEAVAENDKGFSGLQDKGEDGSSEEEEEERGGMNDYE
jgi:hypothetical protein